MDWILELVNDNQLMALVTGVVGLIGTDAFAGWLPNKHLPYRGVTLSVVISICDFISKTCRTIQGFGELSYTEKLKIMESQLKDGIAEYKRFKNGKT